MEGEAEFVGSGSFRVDKERALEVLRDYQLPDPAMFLAAWLRCAEASGASEVSISGTDGGVDVGFDGTPFTLKELSDVYSPILSPSPRQERNRELALGLLAALRGRACVTVRSGDGMLSVPKLGEESASAGKSRGTVLRAAWEGGAPVPDWRAWLKPETACAMARARVRVDGRTLQRAPDPPGSLAFQKGSARGWLRVRAGVGGLESSLLVYKHGVLACRFECDLPAPVTGILNDDRLTLDISQQGVVRNPRLERLLRYLGTLCLELVKRTLSEHEACVRELPGLLSKPRLLDVWKERSAFSASMRYPWSWEEVRASLLGSAHASGHGFGELSIRVLEAAWRMDWLHRAAAAQALPALRSAPLFLRAGGGFMSLAEADALRERLGSIPYSWRTAAAGGDAVWCPSPNEHAWLKMHFGEAIREESSS
ncbi:MAG: hypothetical protein WC728_07370 [Elusimicrobiota bacterium]